MNKTVVLILALLASFESHAVSVELQGSFSTSAGAPIKAIKDLIISEENQIYALDSKNGALILIDAHSQKLERQSLVGEGLFKSKALSGVALDGRGELFLLNSGDHTLAKYDSKTRKLNKKFGEKGTKAGMISRPGQVAISVNQRLYIANRSSISVFSPNGAFLYDLGNEAVKEKLNLNSALQVHVDNRERSYVLDKGSIVYVFAYTGELLARFDAKKLGEDFGLAKAEVSAIAADSAGNLFIAEKQSGKVFFYDWLQQKVISSFGSKGTGPGQYRHITAMSLNERSQLVVADTKNSKIDLYNLGIESTDDSREWLPNVGAVKFSNLSCSNAYRLFDRSILCLDKKTGVVKRLSEDGSSQISAFDKPVKGAKQAAYNDRNVVVLGSDVVGVYDLATAKQTTLFGSYGSKDGELGQGVDVAFRDNKIYVAEYDNSRVQVFTVNGVHLHNIPRDPANIDLFPNPSAVAVDANNYIYVADATKSKILVLNQEGRTLYELGAEASSPAAYENFYDMMFDADNNLYVLARTVTNPATVVVYSGQKKIFQMGSASKNNRYAMYGAKSISVSPNEKTLISIFNKGGANIFNKNTEAVGMLDYNYLQVPLPVAELHVQGGVEETRLSWQKASANYVKRYNILVSDEEDGEFKPLVFTEADEITVAHDAGRSAKFYKVTAISGFGVEGPSSFAQENHFQSAYAYYQSGLYEKSISILQSILSDTPNDPTALRFMGKNYMQMQQFTVAASFFKRLSSFPGQEIEGLNLHIEALSANKDYPEAMALVSEMMQKTDSDENSFLNCGRISLKMGDGIGATECLEKLLLSKPQHPEANLLLSQAYIQVGATDEGLAQLDKATSLNASNINVWVDSGELLFGLEKYARAKDSFQTALQLDANYTPAQLGLAKSALRLEDVALTKNIAIKLAGKPESSSQGNYLLGLLSVQEGKTGAAILALSKSTRSDKANVEAWLLLSQVHDEMGNADKAHSALANAVKADPASYLAAQQYGEVLIQQQDYSKAVELLEQAILLKPDDYALNYQLAQAYVGVNKFLNAIQSGKKAISLNDKSVEAYELSAKAARLQGKVGEAIGFLQQATALSPEVFENHQNLGELYAENNLYTEAELAYQKAAVVDAQSARPHIALGQLLSRQRRFDDAIKAYQKGVGIDASAANKVLLDEAIAAKKASLAFDNGAPQLVFENVKLDNIFSAAYKLYANEALGSVSLRNVSGVDYENLEIELLVKGFMDFPTKQKVEALPANSSKELSLLAVFNNKMLTIDEDTGVQFEIKANFIRDGKKGSINITQPVTLYGKNAIVWNRPNMIGSFVTPRDDALRDFTRRALNEFKPERGPLSENLINAMTLFDSFSAYGMKYVLDPNNPFTDLSKDQIDYVQFARETLRLKSGDCDDLSVLLSASFENLGMKTALLDIPGHVFMMFDTKLPVQQRELVTANPELVVEYEGTIWIPVEATMISTSFTEAWAEGAQKYYENVRKNALKVVPLQSAWKDFQPVTLPASQYAYDLPEKNRVLAAVNQQREILIERSIERLVKPYNAMLQMNPANFSAQMQIAITYGKYGLHQRALEALDRLLEGGLNNSAVYNNKGNVYFSKQNYRRAYEAYAQAEQLDKNDPGVKVNMAMALYKSGETAIAAEKYREASKLNPEIETEYQAFGKLLLN